MIRKFFILCSASLMSVGILTGCQISMSKSGATPTETATPQDSSTDTPDATNEHPTDSTDEKANDETIISEEQAKDIALNDAGFQENDVVGLRVHLDHDDSRPEYDVEFHKDKIKYDYEIDAADGSIISKDTD